MPIYEIQGADGKTYEADAADENTALNAFSAHTQAPTDNRGALAKGVDMLQSVTPLGLVRNIAGAVMHPEDSLKTADAAVRGAANTATLGAADHLAAWANSMTGVDKTPDAAGIAAGEKTPLEKQRGYDTQAEADHPLAYTTGGLAGAFAAPEVGVLKAVPLLKKAAEAGPLVKGISNGVMQGGVSGALNTDGGIDKEIGGAIGGSTMGGMLGSIAPLIPKVGNVIRNGSDILRDPSGQNYALRRIGEAAQETGTDIPTMVQGLEAS
ncbi:MAG: hypothetical protein ABJA10_06680, partial [Aestuariivirga sp.]